MECRAVVAEFIATIVEQAQEIATLRRENHELSNQFNQLQGEYFRLTTEENDNTDPVDTIDTFKRI